ncbi:hypothetical protein AMAG_20623 [Allomyces macrogynus ATCC 38327]|uniref:ABC transmembrane type-1 domain-containing protein n=1 Tax=Allomyces macrogynus (strain ATCC 38327) TaxID=578462 RepID=A0A0L0TDI4_ALLM3|nr:hypothetical protein AMAG_20623 [Allomyces macrogynus ATCC 38327]|eukprot:KNE72730.1 hypothetical protein AMAG_20623 [Allomyces macrogynus ATCC 38327]
MADTAHGGPADRQLWPPPTTVCARILATWSVWTLQRAWAARRLADLSTANGSVLVPYSHRDVLVLRTKSALAWLGASVQVASLAVFTLGLDKVPNGASAAVDVLLFLLEFVPIQARYAMNQDFSPELSASIPSLAVFAWSRDLVRLGSSKVLGMDDLWHVHPRDQSAGLLARPV